MGDESRSASNSVFGFRPADGVRLATAVNATKRGLKLGAEGICTHYLNQVCYREEGKR